VRRKKDVWAAKISRAADGSGTTEIMGPFSRVNFHSTTKKCAKEKQVAIAKKGTGMPRRRYYSYSPWLRTAQRSARLGTLLGGIALGLSTAVGILFVLKNA
jgi:hypothetical protein